MLLKLSKLWTHILIFLASLQVKARIPSTLQPLDDEDEQRRAALRRSREAESEKWESIRKEVDARRAQEQEMERNFVQQGSLAFSDTEKNPLDHVF